LVALGQPFSRAECWQKAMTSRPDLLQFRLDLEKRDIQVSYHFNQLFPSLDMVGSYGGRAISSSFGGAMGDIGDVTYPPTAMGLYSPFR